MSEDRRSGVERADEILAKIKSLPEAENEEQRQVLAGLNEAAGIFRDIIASSEAFIESFNQK